MATPRLENKRIVIIGGTTGIGLSGARACLREGAQLVVVGYDEESAAAAQAEFGGDAHVSCADARDPSTSKEAVARIRNMFGDFHALYHVAGGSGRPWGDGPLHEVSDEGWSKTIDLNQSSVFYSNREAVRAFLEVEHGGSILNLSSALSYSPSPEHFGTYAYAAAKTAILGMTVSSAAYYAENDIRINAIAPGLIESPMSKRAIGDEEIRAFVEARQPLDGGRVGQPQDLDGAVVFLLSDESSFVTGQVLCVDGGWTVTDGGQHG